MEVNLTIITPTLNAETFIHETLKSIVDQHYPALEVIVVDGGSTDRTLEIVDGFTELNTVVIVFPGSSQTEAINEGIKHARGEIINWLNADDILLSGALWSVKNTFESNSNAEILYGSASKIDAHGKVIKPARSRSFSKKMIDRVYYITQPATFYRTSLIRREHGLQNKLEFAMDWDLMLRISNDQNTLSIDKELARLRMYNGTKTSLGGRARMKEIAQISKFHFGFWNRNHIAYLCLVPFFIVSKSTGWRIADRIGSILSAGFDRVWGHMNYMVHYPSFESPRLKKNRNQPVSSPPQQSHLIAEKTAI